MGRQILASSRLARGWQSSAARRALQALEAALAGSAVLGVLLRDRPEWMTSSRTLSSLETGCGRVQGWVRGRTRTLGAARRDSALVRPGAGEGWAAAVGPALLGAGLVGALGALVTGRLVLLAGALAALALGCLWPLVCRAWKYSFLAVGVRSWTRL